MSFEVHEKLDDISRKLSEIRVNLEALVERACGDDKSGHKWLPEATSVCTLEEAEREIKLWFKPEEIIVDLYPTTTKDITTNKKVWA